MTTPTPDSVLRKFLESQRELVDLPDYGTVCRSDMGAFGTDIAADLLALREAAGILIRRRSALADQCLCGWLFVHEVGAKAMSEAWARHGESCPIEKIRALLPEVAG